MEQLTKDLNFVEYQYRISNFENFRIYSKSGRYHYFSFQKSFRFDCRDYDKDALIEFGTGYKDKNGKEIFQNDIVCIKDYNGRKKYHRVIKSDEGYYTYDDNLLDSDEKSIEVVGHIHSKNFEIWRDYAHYFEFVEESELNADCIPLKVELKGQRYFKQLAEVIAQIAEKENLNLETFCTKLKLSAREIRNKEVQQ